jgi:2-polyprenyl-6-methoxyphenol hydroxylase-like FAD-dependent oxidoreductase
MEYDVVVAGAGPVGLMLACELRLQGVEVLVVERRTEPDMTVKAGSITVPTAEAFERRGMLPAIAHFQEQALAQMAAFRGGLRLLMATDRRHRRDRDLRYISPASGTST